MLECVLHTFLRIMGMMRTAIVAGSPNPAHGTTRKDDCHMAARARGNRPTRAPRRGLCVYIERQEVHMKLAVCLFGLALAMSSVPSDAQPLASVERDPASGRSR